MSIEGKLENRTGAQESGNEAWLKQNSLDLTAVHLSGLGERADRLVSYEPGEWNEQNGIIMFADAEGALGAIPATDVAREKFTSDPTFTKVEGKGVLNLNDTDMVWGGKEKNATNTMFNRWTELTLSTRNLQTGEILAERVGQDAERDAIEEELNEQR
jgi:hypothetical protein